MKASKVTVGDHPWKPAVMPIADLAAFLGFTVMFFGGQMFGWWPLPTWFKVVGYCVFIIPMAFDVYNWLWKKRRERWTMKNSEWIYDQLHPKPDGSHDNI